MNVHDRGPETSGQDVADWESKEVAAFLKKQAERKEQFFTLGGIPVKDIRREQVQGPNASQRACT